MDKNNNRPIFLNLFKIRMPVTAVLSISHRISGVILALLIPAALFVFDRSLESEQGFHYVSQLMTHPVVKTGLLILIWAVALHFFAGIRFLLIDFGFFVDKTQARAGSWLVHGLAIVCVIIMVSLFI